MIHEFLKEKVMQKSELSKGNGVKQEGGLYEAAFHENRVLFFKNTKFRLLIFSFIIFWGYHLHIISSFDKREEK